MNLNTEPGNIRSTTVLAVRRNNQVAIGADGQVTLGTMIIKQNARKVRRIEKFNAAAGFAGSTADALTLFDKFEMHLEKYSGNLKRACIELAKEWRQDKYLRRLEAMMIVVNSDSLFLLSGSGDIIEPENSLAAVGSGSGFAQAAAMVFLNETNESAAGIVKKSLNIAADICIYTNHQIQLEVIE